MFQNLNVRHLIIHEIFPRNEDGSVRDPLYGDELLRIGERALGVFRDRVVEALGRQSQSMELDILDASTGSALDISKRLIASTDEAEYATISREFANQLAAAQVSRKLPGGVIVVFNGTSGHPATEIIGVIKAETHAGFRKADQSTLELLSDLFLTPQTKLYKIGVFKLTSGGGSEQSTNSWRAAVYDSNMSMTHRDAAAKYFYDTFLGLGIPTNSARLTKNFYDHTREFIQFSDLDDDQKSDLATSLYSYLKVDQTPTIDTAHFSQTYLPNDLRDAYQQHMRKRSFPATAVSKDISELTGVLKRRKITFSRDIRLIAPPDAFNELVDVQTVDATTDVGPRKWTQITIRDWIRALT